MTNPTAAMRMLITYAICIPVAIFVGFLLTNPLDYGTLGFLGVLIAVIVSPLFIKWYYPLTIFALACPMVCFFLPGKPPFQQVMVLIALLVILTERILTSGKRSVSTPVMTWPLLYILAVTYMTAELNGGIGLQALGGGSGGGRKYIDIFIGCGVYFVVTSQAIPRNLRNRYLILMFLPGLLGVIGNFYPILPSPLNKINLLFPPTSLFEEGMSLGTTRLTAFTSAFGTIICFMLVKYGLSGIFSARHPGRSLIFIASFFLSMLGGYRNAFGGTVLTLTLLFFMEGLHRSRLMPMIILGGIVGAVVLFTCSNKLPYTFQRSMSFLPLKWDNDVILDAEGSSEWRYKIWRATWPKVPDHLLLGKGYVITKEDYEMMGNGTFTFLAASHIEGDSDPLAVSGDYHSGPLSTLMPFGLWGGIAVVWFFGATLYVLHRNYRYGNPELRTINNYFLASGIISIFSFFFLFGSYKDIMSAYGGLCGFSLAMNGGLCRRPAPAAVNQRIKPISAGIPQAA